MKLSSKKLAEILVDEIHDKSGKACEKVVADFMQYLHDVKELGRVREIIRSLDQVWKKRFGAANIRVECAHTLSSALMKKLEQKSHGASVQVVVKPELIGGARVRVDDEIIDGSVLGTIQSLKQSLSKL